MLETWPDESNDAMDVQYAHNTKKYHTVTGTGGITYLASEKKWY